MAETYQTTNCNENDLGTFVYSVARGVSFASPEYQMAARIHKHIFHSQCEDCYGRAMDGVSNLPEGMRGNFHTNLNSLRELVEKTA